MKEDKFTVAYLETNETHSMNDCKYIKKNSSSAVELL